MKLTIAGESHGKAICGVLSGVPAGLKLCENQINSLLSERSSAFGRSSRQLFEKDKIDIISGVRGGYTLGGNISFLIENVAYREHVEDMDVWQSFKKQEITAPRAGHADLSGVLKYGFSDISNVSEGASARSTCAIVAAGAIALRLLDELGIKIAAAVSGIADYSDDSSFDYASVEKACAPMYLLDASYNSSVEKSVSAAKKLGDTLGGKVVLAAKGVKAGFGGYSFEKRVNGLIASLLMQMQAVRGVYFGDNPFTCSNGLNRVDKIEYEKSRGGFYRSANHSGGIEGGMTDGEEILITVGIRPIPTLPAGVETTDLITKKKVLAASPRSDVTAVFAACPVLKSLLALALTECISERIGCDNLADMKVRYIALP